MEGKAAARSESPTIVIKKRKEESDIISSLSARDWGNSLLYKGENKEHRVPRPRKEKREREERFPFAFDKAKGEVKVGGRPRQVEKKRREGSSCPISERRIV